MQESQGFEVLLMGGVRGIAVNLRSLKRFKREDY